MNSFDKVYFKILLEQSQFICETDRTTKIIAKIGGGLLGMFIGNKIGKLAGEKLGEYIGVKFGSDVAAKAVGEEAVKRATEQGVEYSSNILKRGIQKTATAAAKEIINKSSNIGSAIGKTVGKATGTIAGTYGGAKTGEYIEDKLTNAINSQNHDAWFVTMKKDNKQYYLTLNSKELVSEDPSKAAILTKQDGFESDKDIQEKFEKDQVYEALKDFKDIQIIGYEQSKIN